MGVPKFYRWISERYPCLSQVLKEHQIPEFDNLYLDMNGIIHQCSHPNDDDVHFRISEDKIFADIFHYLEVLFRIIKPRKVFFMAVDGVAPRAKMNQQRGRRFRSAKEAEDKIKKALEKGEILPTEARFDSNCITPGTEFMARLHEHLKYFVNMKISTDKSWQGITVYLSGHETPGEGEHKIMEFIRSEKAKPHHDPNTRHCLYGLDADLIMLGLTTHEAHFALLREEVRFGGKKSQRACAPEETTFHLLHLSLMREYIDYEFSPVKDKISFDYDIEKIIDDWILMGFLVGNDFIPHLPHLHINHDALPLLYRTYMAILPELGGYINENGHLNLKRFEKYLARLSDFDREHFSEVFVDLKWFESKVGNKYLNEAAGIAAEEARNNKQKKRKAQENSLCLAALEKNEDEVVTSKTALEDEPEDDDLFETEFRQYKRTYYMTKMGIEVVSDKWVKIKVFHSSVCALHFHSKRLLEAMESCNKCLKEEEKQRNVHSACLMYWYDKDAEFQYLSPWPEKFPAIERCHTRFEFVLSSEYFMLDPFLLQKQFENVFKKPLECVKKKKKLVTVTSLFQTVENVASLVLGKVVFVNWPHLEEARVVAVSDGETKFYLEEPHGTQKLYMGNAVPPTKVTFVGDKEQSTWLKEVQGVSEHYQRRKGIIIHETSVVVYAQLLTGNRYQLNQNGQVYLEKQWSKQVLPFVYQTVVKDIKAFDSRFSNIKTLDDLFPPGSTAFMLGSPYYGCMGEVSSIPHGDHKANVGLNLKFNKKNEEVPGYTKKVGNEWMYSSAVEQLLPLEQQNGVVPDRDAEYRLFDRVVNVRENFSVPVGLRGTIIGIKGGNIFFITVEFLFNFMCYPATMTVCHIKLSNGLLVHGPQCHSEAEAKEKAALFALQRLSSVGVNLPFPPPVFPNYQPLGVPVPPGSIPPVFPQPPANIIPPSSHMFGPVSWGTPVPIHGKHYYPGSYPGNVSLAGTIPVGSHNQFIPLQVTKKRAASKKNFEFKEFQSSPQAAPLKNEQPVSSDHIQQDSSSAPLKSPQAAQSTVSFQDNVATPSVPRNKSTPNTSSKRKPRKLAVNFGTPKSAE
uniref:5'-3' exoribonuclease 1 n=1 Tax=Pavo cristatus TaxID=9049 RepID=A0A8C9LER9_PAVCR